MRTFLIATDGSRAATEAVELGVELAAEQGARVVFLHVQTDTAVWPILVGAVGEPPRPLSVAEDEILAEAVQLAAARGVEARATTRVGDPIHEIDTAADEVGADLVVLGSRGLGAISGALLGSVSRGVLHGTDRPVLVVREKARAATGARA